MPTDRSQTIEQGSKTLICILVTKTGHRSSPERVFLEIRCLHSFVGQIQANVTKWPHEFRNRIPFFSRRKAKLFEQHILLAKFHSMTSTEFESEFRFAWIEKWNSVANFAGPFCNICFYLTDEKRKEEGLCCGVIYSEMPTDRSQTIEQGSKTLICILVTKTGHRSSPERVFLEIRCLHSFVGQIQANVTKWLHEFRNRIPFFSRRKAKLFEQHILLACLPISSITVTLVDMPTTTA
ncbi:hypothetical protein T265_06979 [Opisthorchis viverrini]|uniref:Uncharacterized protein n=1 Tax=Opisthorchis viverrini TaxID=6198 RepID=A0A074ZE78_OPIVI|nr:hypothetical protein T265_06979 [Opisthorchis viverrini]KER25576.1 hypothetical protein T265_06979 [Opisthorchis viverrini]